MLLVLVVVVVGGGVILVPIGTHGVIHPFRVQVPGRVAHTPRGDRRLNEGPLAGSPPSEVLHGPLELPRGRDDGVVIDAVGGG